MPLITFLLGFIGLLVVLGLVMYLVNTFIPMEPRLKSLMNTVVVIVVVVVVILWLLSILGVVPAGFWNVRVPQ